MRRDTHHSPTFLEGGRQGWLQVGAPTEGR